MSSSINSAKKALLLFAVLLFSLLATGCGLAERNKEKQVFKEYPTLPGDKMVKIRNVVKQGGVVDSTIVVKNGEDYFIVRKDGSRQPAKQFVYRK